MEIGLPSSQTATAGGESKCLIAFNGPLLANKVRLLLPGVVIGHRRRRMFVRNPEQGPTQLFISGT